MSHDFIMLYILVLIVNSEGVLQASCQAVIFIFYTRRIAAHMARFATHAVNYLPPPLPCVQSGDMADRL